MKKYLCSFFALALCAMLFTNCDDKTNPIVNVTGITLTKTTLSLVTGNSETLVATIAPENATNKNVLWTSSDPLKATVDLNGKVTALLPGTTTITVKTLDGEKTATCAVTVTPTTVAVTGVTINKPTLQLVAGADETLVATIAPENATNKNVLWTSSDPLKATVDLNGKVTAVAAGTATITATSAADNTKKSTCAVTVLPAIVNLFTNGDFSLFDPTTPTTLSHWFFDPVLVANVDPIWGGNGWSMEIANGTFLKTWGEGRDKREASTWTESLGAGTYTLTIKYKSSWGIWLNVAGVTTDPNKQFAELPGWIDSETSTFTTDVEVTTMGTVTLKITISSIESANTAWNRYIEIYSVLLVKKQ